jgi:hypothetical protein
MICFIFGLMIGDYYEGINVNDWIFYWFVCWICWLEGKEGWIYIEANEMIVRCNVIVL